MHNNFLIKYIIILVGRCIVGPTPEMVQQFIGYGYNYVAVASDMGMMMRQANAFFAAMKPALAGSVKKVLNTGVY